MSCLISFAFHSYQPSHLVGSCKLHPSVCTELMDVILCWSATGVSVCRSLQVNVAYEFGPAFPAVPNMLCLSCIFMYIKFTLFTKSIVISNHFFYLCYTAGSTRFLESILPLPLSISLLASFTLPDTNRTKFYKFNSFVFLVYVFIFMIKKWSESLRCVVANELKFQSHFGKVWTLLSSPAIVV